MRMHPEISNALAAGLPVVALESAVITAGLPRAPASLPSTLAIPGWNSSEPVNLELARAMQRAVRAAGAVPCTVALLDGSLHAGLDDAQLERLARDGDAAKASVTDLAAMMTSRRCAGLTVSATLAACAQTHAYAAASPNDPRAGIRVFATGGIGGVHRGWTIKPDVSADLRALARTPVCVVCSGAKSILDVPATLEALETLGVPVVGVGCDRFPLFQAGVSDTARLRHTAASPADIAMACAAHWHELGLRSALLAVQPAPAALAVSAAEIETATNLAEHTATERGVHGPERTPFLLAEIARITGNRSLVANLALLVNNARLAASVACALARPS